MILMPQTLGQAKHRRPAAEVATALCNHILPSISSKERLNGLLENGLIAIGEIPSHAHQIVMPPRLYAERDTTQTSIICVNDNQSANQMTYNTTPAGGSSAHNNMQPFLSVFMWKRIQ